MPEVVRVMPVAVLCASISAMLLCSRWVRKRAAASTTIQRRSPTKPQGSMSAVMCTPPRSPFTGWMRKSATVARFSIVMRELSR